MLEKVLMPYTEMKATFFFIFYLDTICQKWKLRKY